MQKMVILFMKKLYLIYRDGPTVLKKQLKGCVFLEM